MIGLFNRLGTGRTFIVLVFGAVVTLNIFVGEAALIQGVYPPLLGGPITEVTGFPEAGADALPAFDTLSVVSQAASAFPLDGSPLIRFGDTLGGAANPSGELVEWVAQDAEIITHTVKDKETVSDIARIYGVSVETILWANALRQSSIIRPGDELKFPSLSGILHRVRSGETLSGIASAYGVNIERITAANRGLTASINPGDEIIIPGGRLAAPTLRALPLSTAAYFIMPTTGLNWGRYHRVNATDIANVCGTPVWAAASGIVTQVAYGWNGGYGNLIRISHPNGMQTLYAHMQTILVRTGAPVSQGEQIGTIGNTGRTHGPTGCHLHFEVRGGVNPFIRYR